MRKVTPTVVLAFCASSSCGLDSTASEDDSCDGPVAVAVSADQVPVISWTPRCRADYVAVGYAGLNDVWWAYTLTPVGIPPAVRVGDEPPGTRAESLLHLVRGVQYSVSVGWRRSDGAGFEVGSWGHTRFVY